MLGVGQMLPASAALRYRRKKVPCLFWHRSKASTKPRTAKHPFPGGGSKWQVSSGGVASNDNNTSVVDWSPDGRSLHYRQGDKIYTVDARVDGNKPEFSAPKVLMSVPQDIDLLSILTDGKRILATRPIGQRIATPQNLVLNWHHLVQ